MLKKLLITAILSSFAGTAFATATAVTGPTLYNVTDSPATALGITGFNKSKNVQAVYASGNTGANVVDVYAVSTKHVQGDKMFGATSASSYIFIKQSSAGTPLTTGDNPSLPATPSDSSITNAFSAM